MAINKFEDLICWQKSRILVNNIYKVTTIGKFSNDFVLIKQIRRAAISIMLNISEGFARGTNGQLHYFLSVAKGSLVEVQSCLYISKDLNYISEEQFSELYDDCSEIFRIIIGLMKSIDK